MASNSGSSPPKFEDVFVGAADRFNGLTIDSREQNCDISTFLNKLEASLNVWTEIKRRGIWFRVFLDQANWVPILAQNGFKFHHAKENFVMMYKWLPKDEICNVPPYAHTMIGVGAVVVNNKNQILVVREKYWKLPHWKLPGGYVEPGENLVDAAIREVKEETNIKAEFQSLLTLRHAHNGMFNCSDIYTVISLKPLTQDITSCEMEIAEAKWMDIDEYLNHPNIHELNRLFVEKYLEYANKNVKMDLQHGIHQILNKPYTVYYITSQEEEKAGN